MKSSCFVSIIIPVKKINNYIRESLPKILKLSKSNIEIIIFSDEKEDNYDWPHTRIISSGIIGPAEKRDLAIKYAKGNILAFIDDDAYPDNSWLTKALDHFNDIKVGAVGGPAITPKHDSILQKVSGAVSESYLGGGGARNRFISTGKSCNIDDWPTVNLLVRSDIFKKIGGFDSTYWPGEDTKLCLDIINSGYKIIYEPESIVYHHRRSNILNHFKQIGNYGLHRGYFVKKYPQTSLRLWYFIPSLFDFYLMSILILAVFHQYNFLKFYLAPLYVYFLGLILDSFIISIRWKNIFVGLLTIPMIFLTHIWYGIRFIYGLTLSELTR